MKDKILFLKKVWVVAKQYKWHFLLSYLILLLELVFSQIVPILLGNVIDAAVYKSDLLLFFKAAGVYSLVFLGYLACGFCQLQVWQRLNNKYIYGLQIRCFEKVLRLNARSLADIKTGDVIHTINEDTGEFHHILQRYAMRIVNAGIGTIVSLSIVACLNFKIALLMLVLIPTSLVLTERIKRKIRKISEDLRTNQGNYNAWLMEILKGIRVVKLFAAEKKVQDDFVSKNKKIINSKNKFEQSSFSANQIINSIQFTAQIIFYIVSAAFVINGSINVAEYITIASYYFLVSNNFQRILQDNMAFQARRVAVDRVFSILDDKAEDDIELPSLSVPEGKIKIEGLCYSYDKERYVLQDISYVMQPGKCIGLVGESGVGKSTFAQILIRFLDPDQGVVEIDGQDISRYSCESIRTSIGIVSQDTIIFDTTIKDNICFGIDIPDSMVWDVLDKAYLKQDIEKFPDGIYTVLGQDRYNLSGGQKQRLSIARLLFRNPPIIILDEATSALDEKSEEIVQKALDNLTLGRTSIVISHRLRNICNADEIIVLEDGKIVDSGDCTYLLENSMAFYNLFGSQAKKMGLIEHET